MSNVFADTHDRPAAPSPGPYTFRQPARMLSEIRTATYARLCEIALAVGLSRRPEFSSEIRARLIDSLAGYLVTRLEESQALVGRVRASIGARSGESTDAALARLDAEMCAARAGANRATLDAVKHAVGLPAETPASEVSAFFRRFEADVEGAIAPTKRGAWETLGEAIKRHHAALEGVLRGVRNALDAPEGADLVEAVADLRATLSAVERATGMPAGTPAAEVRAHFDRLSASALEATSRMPARAGETLVERVDRFFREADDARLRVAEACAALGCHPDRIVEVAVAARVAQDRLRKIRAAVNE